MREFIESHFGAVILRWAEPDEDGHGELYEALHLGQLIRADSPLLLLRAVTDLEPAVGRVVYLPANTHLAWAA